MTRLLFARWTHSQKSGWRPDLPRTASFHVLAHSGKSHEWALIRVTSRAKPATTIEVPSALASRIESGKQYPPALAIAFEQLNRFGNPSWTPDEITVRLGSLIETHLRAQAKSKYVQVEAAHEEVGYLNRGEFVWALGMSRSEERSAANVIWVSSDLQIYANPKSHFRLSRAIDCALGLWTLPLPPWHSRIKN